MAKIICDYCEFGTDDKLCYKGGMEKCQGELFLAKAQKPDARTNTLPIQNVNVSALLEERKQYKLKEIWGCDEEDLTDKEKYQLNVDLGIIKDFLEWMHSR